MLVKIIPELGLFALIVAFYANQQDRGKTNAAIPHH